MQMPGRSYTASSSYRYGFNGKEKDPETYGEGNIYDYGFRIYDPRLGRFKSVDPLTQSYPWYTPYQFAGNKPILCIDLDGAEEYHYLRLKDRDGNTVLALLEVKDIVDQVVTKWKLGRGGMLPVETKDVKNSHQIYIVHQESEVEYDGGAYVYDYDEDVVFIDKNKAKNSSDQDFQGTDDDFYAQFAGAISYNVDGMTSAPSIDWNTADFLNRRGSRARGLKGAKGGVEFHMHHLISKGLGKTSAFVKKAIEGGFKLNGKMNLTPVERFIKKFGTGVHAKHTKYTAQIRDFLEGLDIKKFTPKKANEVLQKLNDHIIEKIKQNDGVKINDIDLDLKNFKYE